MILVLIFFCAILWTFAAVRCLVRWEPQYFWISAFTASVCWAFRLADLVD